MFLGESKGSIGKKRVKKDKVVWISVVFKVDIEHVFLYLKKAETSIKLERETNLKT